jgi:hypothetical protein
MTMIFFTLCETIEKKFGRKWQEIEHALDDNFGCFDLETENDLQKKFKQIKKVDKF